jgi:serine/threonine-protein kinase
MISEKDGMELIYIPAGEFMMGSDDEDAKKTEAGGVASPEIPVHRLYLEAYWIDKFEVSNAQYRRCVEAGECLAPRLPLSYMGVEYYDNPEYADYPVIYVDYFLARSYCAWAGRRLPTEAEWAKAARGTDGRRYTWGSEPVSGERANFCDRNCPKTHADSLFDDGYAETAPVGSYPAGASPYGVMDMAGNVWEWTSTIPQPYPYDPTDGREAAEPRTREEVAFGDGPQRVWRGGTWANGTWWLRAAIRYHSVPGYWHNSLGFRCAQSP